MAREDWSAASEASFITPEESAPLNPMNRHHLPEESHDGSISFGRHLAREMRRRQIEQDHALVEHAQRETESRRQAEFYAAAMNAGVHVTSDGRILSVNPAAARWLGDSAEKLTGLAFESCLAADGAEIFRAALARAFSAGDRAGCSLLLRQPAGSLPKPVHCSFALSPQAGECCLILDATRDVTVLTPAIDRAFDEAAVGLGVVALNGEWLRVNRHLASMLGYTIAELLERNVTEVTHPPDLDRDIALAGELLSGARSTYTLEKRYVRRDGSIFWASLECSLVRGSGGRPEHFVGVVQDLSFRKEAEEKVRLLSACVERMSDAIVVTRLQPDRPSEPEIIFANDAASRMSGYPIAELVGQTPAMFQSPAADRRTLEGICEDLSAGRPAHAELLNRRKNGAEYWVDIDVTTITDAQHRPTHRIAIQRDITERRRTVAALQVTQERYALAIRGLADGLWDWDLRSGEEYLSPRWQELLGFAPGDPVGAAANFRARMHPEDQERGLEALRAHLEERQTFDVELRLQRADGSYRWFRLRGQAIWDAEGRPTRLAGGLTDIDEWHAARTVLHETNVSLEQRVRERTRDLQEAQRLARLGSWTWDIAEDRVSWTEELYRIHGLDPNRPAPPYAEHESFHTPESWVLLEAAVKAAVEQGTPYSLELELIRPDGLRGFIRGVGEAVRDSHGRVYRLRGTAQDVTEQRNAERQVREQRNLYETVLEQSLAGFWDWNLRDDTQYYSPAFKRMFGYEDHELPNTPDTWRRLIFPEDLVRALADVQRHIESAGAVPYRLEVRYRHKDGSTVWVICCGRVIDWDADGRPLRMVGCHIDITARKEAEEQLQAVSERLQLSASITGLAVAEIDYATGLVQLSREAAALYGMPAVAAQRPAVDLRALFHPEDREALLREIARSHDPSGSGQLAMEHRIVCPDGSIRWHSARTQVFFDRSVDPPRCTHALAAIFDITDRKEAERELASTRERLALATKAGQVGVWDWDAVRDVLVWDDQMFALYGRSRADGPLNIKSWESALHPDDRARAYQQFREALQRGRELDVEFRVVWGDGSVRTIKSKALTQFDATGRAVRILGTNWDITERRQAEEELRSAMVQLAASNRELNAFSYSVSHDLRAPLRGIDGWSLALLEDYAEALDERGREYLGRVRTETQRMGELIDGLLRLSRFAQSEMRVVAADLSLEVRETIQRLRESQPERRIEVIIAPDLSAQADLPLLRAALANLLENAWKFTNKVVAPRIEVGHERTPDGPAFFVRDNGAGFDPARAKRLFAPFQRLHRSSEFPGAGIGLATVQRVIQRHGGRVWAESAPGAGATFYFQLPAGTPALRPTHGKTDSPR